MAAGGQNWNKVKDKIRELRQLRKKREERLWQVSQRPWNHSCPAPWQTSEVLSIELERASSCLSKISTNSPVITLRVTGLHNSYPRVIAAFKVLLERVYLLRICPFYENSLFAIHGHKVTHHEKFVPSRRITHILSYVWVALATTDVQGTLEIPATDEPGGGTLGISRWACAAGTLEPLAYTRASSAEFCYPILE